jgi:rubrerythrin
VKPCDRNIFDTLHLAQDMIRLADRGDAQREDTGCGILYGILRDSAYKIRQLAEQEKKNHQAKGWWKLDRTMPGTQMDERHEQYSSTTCFQKGGKNVSSIKNTLTEKNLLASFAGESQARNRYTYFASQARKEGFVQIADIFEETANQEKEHAKRFFKFLEGGDIEIVAAFPAGVIGSTLENLDAAADGEKHEHTNMYPGFAKIAREEGFDAIAMVWDAISVAEKQHEKRYRDLAQNIQAGRVFAREQQVVWRCRNCGYLHTALAAPEMCPACAHPQAYFELLGENW